MSFGNNLKRLRRDAGLTQGELAEKCYIRLGHISKLERNLGDPKLSSIKKLAKALNVSHESLTMDPNESGLSGIARALVERIENLPDDRKAIIIDVVDNYCASIGLKTQLEGQDNGIWLNWKGATKDMIPEQ